MKAVIIDYKAGNIESVFNALQTKKAALDEIIISNKISDLRLASHLILPGVGAFGDCMDGLRAVEGFLSELRKQVLVEKKPFLGICVGMQVLANVGFENGEHVGLGFVNGRVEKIQAAEENLALKLPHMGWNDVAIKPNKHAVLRGIESGEHFYFANSFHFIAQNENNVLAQVEYGGKLTAIIAKENIFGTQFHPEKSGEAGLKLLKNFLDWRP